MHVGIYLTLPGLPPSGGSALGQILAAHVWQVIPGSPGRCCSLPSTGAHLKPGEVHLCPNPPLHLLGSPSGHLPQCSGSKGHRVKAQGASCLKSLRILRCFSAQQIVKRPLLSTRPSECQAWEGREALGAPWALCTEGLGQLAE